MIPHPLRTPMVIGCCAWCGQELTFEDTARNINGEWMCAECDQPPVEHVHTCCMCEEPFTCLRPNCKLEGYGIVCLKPGCIQEWEEDADE